MNRTQDTIRSEFGSGFGRSYDLKILFRDLLTFHKSSTSKGQTQRYVVKVPKSAGAGPVSETLATFYLCYI